MMHFIHKTQKSITLTIPLILTTALLLTLLICGESSAAKISQKTFVSPEEAVKALIIAVRNGDVRELIAMFGPSGKNLISSGDEAQDKEGREGFLKAYEEKNRLEIIGDRKAVLHVGNDDWPMPIPIVKTEKKWSFKTQEGAKEILARRIGRNELGAIQVCLAYVDAQREYAEKHGGNGLLEYAQRFTSDPGRKNGLCWEDEGDNNPSPMGPLVARACKSSLEPRQTGVEPAPYHGYFYKILTGQGKNASGGAYSYVVKDRMIGGFALAAYPARYRSTGVMTFIVNQDGIVYQKNLGRNTEKTAETMNLFNPDNTWRKVE